MEQGKDDTMTLPLYGLCGQLHNVSRPKTQLGHGLTASPMNGTNTKYQFKVQN